MEERLSQPSLLTFLFFLGELGHSLGICARFWARWACRILSGNAIFRIGLSTRPGPAVDGGATVPMCERKVHSVVFLYLHIYVRI